MDITWHGGACFRMQGEDAVVWTNPPAGDDERLEATIVLRNARDEATKPNAGGDPFVIDGPGEFEIGTVFVIGTEARGANSDKSKRHTVYAVRFDGITVCVVGAGSTAPTETAAAELGDVDVLLVPIGGDGLSASITAEVVGRLEPSIVIPAPMEGEGSKALASFLTEMGAANLETEGSFKALPNRMPEETKVALLGLESTP